MFPPFVMDVDYYGHTMTDDFIASMAVLLIAFGFIAVLNFIVMNIKPVNKHSNKDSNVDI